MGSDRITGGKHAGNQPGDLCDAIALGACDVVILDPWRNPPQSDQTEEGFLLTATDASCNAINTTLALELAGNMVELTRSGTAQKKRPAANLHAECHPIMHRKLFEISIF